MQDAATTFDSVLENGSFYSYNGTNSTNKQINLNLNSMTPAQYNEYQRQANVIDEAKKWKKEEMGKQQTEISDEEIYKEAEHKSKIFRGWTTYETSAFIMACQWYREQLNLKLK